MKRIMMLAALAAFTGMALSAGETKIELPEVAQWKHTTRGSSVEVIEEQGKKHVKIKKSSKKVVALVYIFKPAQKINPGSFLEVCFEAKGSGIIEVRLGGEVKGKYKTIFAKHLKINSPDAWKKFSVETKLQAESLKAIALNVRGKSGDEEYAVKNVKMLMDDGN